MRNAIFTYCNFQINPDIALYQSQVINKTIAGSGIDFHPLTYNAKDGDVVPDQVIEYGLGTLFNQGYDNILILDIDCIPLSLQALTYVFEQAGRGILVGNAQRSHHLQNDEHVFIGSSCLCLNRDVYEKLGRPSFAPTNRGDIAEELVYIADSKNMPVEFFVPHSYEDLPFLKFAWALKGDMKPYGIGTTFMKPDGELMFYHLFESRTNLHVDKFINKCKTILDI